MGAIDRDVLKRESCNIGLTVHVYCNLGMVEWEVLGEKCIGSIYVQHI